jgi:hypothetical protein
LARLDGVREGSEQPERPQAAFEQFQPLPIGGEDSQHARAVFAQLSQQLETRAVLETLAGHDDLELVDSQEIEAICLRSDRVDDEILAQRLRDRCEKCGILIDDENAHKSVDAPILGTIADQWAPASGRGE